MDNDKVHNKIYIKKKLNNSKSYLRLRKTSPIQNKSSNNTKIENNISKKPLDNDLTKENKITKIEKQEKEIVENSSENSELKILLYPDNKPKNNFEKKPLKNKIKDNTIGYSFDINKELGFINSNVPLLNGFYLAHINHYPIRIKPDDIWLLIVQAFTYHVNKNKEKLRKSFVNFDGKIDCKVGYETSFSGINKNILEDFAEQINKQMKNYLGKDILEVLTPNFTTTNHDSKIVGKLSIMGAFQNYFHYTMLAYACGIPYIILEGTYEDYKKIKEKAEYLKKYQFEWYIDRIIPVVEKIIDAKKGNIDTKFFKNIIQQREVEEKVGFCTYSIEKINYINGWIIKFFAYYNSGEKIENEQIKFEKFKDIANQLLIVPFTFKEKDENQYQMEYQVGFIGCDQNEKNEVYPVQGWLVNKI